MKVGERMKVALAATWHPRGEESRFERLLPTLAAVYSHMVITLPPDVDPQVVQALEDLNRSSAASVLPVVTERWAFGRHLALQTALDTPVDYVQYADLDRLLRWVETRPEEWRRTVDALQETDCLVIGRTPAAYATHPQALVQTEAISNQVVSHLLGQPVDASAGSKGFSRRAAHWIVKHAAADQPFGTDAEWPILARQGGFRVDSCLVDGLDWESADRYQGAAAAAERQRQAAKEYDADPQNWAYRTQVAAEIVSAALRASNHQL